MDIIDVEDPVEQNFTLPEKKQDTATIVEAIGNHEKDVNNPTKNSARTKFKIQHNKDKFEEILSYNKIIDHIECSENAPVMWELDEIIGHQGPLLHNHPNYDGSPYNVTVRWSNGETTDELLSIIATDAPVACAVYAKKKKLLNQPGWKRFKRIAKQQGKMFTDVNKIKLRSQHLKSKFKYGLEVPRT